MKARVVFFGASKAGLQTLETLKDKVNVIAFADNDTKKQNKSINGIKIISPDDIVNVDFDGVVISSMYVVEIYNQLISLGIPPDKIITQWSSALNRRSVFPWDVIVFLFAVFVVIALLIF